MGFFRSLGRMFTGRKPKVEQIQRFTEPQQAALSQLLSQGMRDVDPALLEKKYRGQFERETVPGLAERFTAMGGGQRSSAFEESLRRGGLDLAEQLAGLRAQTGMQKLGLGLQPQFDTVMTPGSPGLLQGLMGGVTGVLAGGLGSRLGGMLGLGRQMAPRSYVPPKGAYLPGQPRGIRKGISPVLLKILEGIQL